MSLLDGATASRISEQSIGKAGDSVSAVQSGGQSGAGAYVVDRTTGDITRIDGATLQPGTPVRFSSPGDMSLALVSNATATWVIQQEGTLAEQVDPTSLAPLGPSVPLSDTAQPIETPNGSLWTVGAGDTCTRSTLGCGTAGPSR